MNQPLKRTSPLGDLAKALFRRAIGDKRLGQLDHFRFPERGNVFGGAFNGQRRRQELFIALINALKPTSIVETGTFLGTTTELFASTGLPVFTIEGHARSYGFARARLRRFRNVQIIYGDSRSALRKILAARSRLPNVGNPFFYLDAHWNDDLPLAEELEIIFEMKPTALVMVDDFEVPGDPAYGFDDYGPGKVLNAAYIQPVVQKRNLMSFYPNAPGDGETGERRGCVVLADRTQTGIMLQREHLLREASRPPFLLDHQDPF